MLHPRSRAKGASRHVLNGEVGVQCLKSKRGAIGAFVRLREKNRLQFEVEAHMKNPTWDDSRPHSEEEVKTEIDRLTLEIRQMIEATRQNHEEAERRSANTRRIIRSIQEQFPMG